MDYRRVGHTGLYVGPLGIGTMTWARDTDAEEARNQLRALLDAGSNVVDTAPSYGDGGAEPLLGKLLEDEFSRDDLVISTKAGVTTRPDGTSVIDTSRATMLSNLDQSLEALGTDYVDIWFVQNFDPRTRWRETLSALTMALRSGRTRYVGVSNFPGWAVARIATALEDEGWELAAVQNEYSLLERGSEREVIPAAVACGAGFFAWSPGGRGVLTGKYRGSTPPDSRAASVHLAGFVEPYLDDEYVGVVDATVAAAEGLDRTPIEVAMAWVTSQKHVSCALSGARTAQQIRAILDGNPYTLPHQITTALSEVSAPKIGYPERLAYV